MAKKIAKRNYEDGDTCAICNAKLGHGIPGIRNPPVYALGDGEDASALCPECAKLIAERSDADLPAGDWLDGLLEGLYGEDARKGGDVPVKKYRSGRIAKTVYTTRRARIRNCLSMTDPEDYALLYLRYAGSWPGAMPGRLPWDKWNRTGELKAAREKYEKDPKAAEEALSDAENRLRDYGLKAWILNGESDLEPVFSEKARRLLTFAGAWTVAGLNRVSVDDIVARLMHMGDQRYSLGIDVQQGIAAAIAEIYVNMANAWPEAPGCGPRIRGDGFECRGCFNRDRCAMRRHFVNELDEDSLGCFIDDYDNIEETGPIKKDK